MFKDRLKRLEYCKAYRLKYLEKLKEYDRVRGRSEERKKRCREYQRHKRRTDFQWAEKERKRSKEKHQKNKIKNRIREQLKYHTQKNTARWKFKLAIKQGKIIRPIHCAYCNKKCKPDGHHYMGYNNPYKVIWLCKICHGAAHQI